MHTIQPNQRIRILTIQIAVPNEAEPDAVADELTWLLSENGTRSDSSNILDWHYLTEYQPQVVADNELEEGEVFGLLDFKLLITPKE
jgi:hypothetical protein